MNIDKKTRVSVIGLGRMGARVIEAAKSADMEVVAVHDISPDAFALEDDLSLREVFIPDVNNFWSTETDIIAIATTAPWHMPLLSEGLRRGHRRFMVEKMLAAGVGEARDVLGQAQAVDARVIVNHVRRFNPNYKVLKSLIGSPEMGDLRSIFISHGGGGFGCLGPHHFDLIDMLFEAYPERVSATLTVPQHVNPRGEQFDDPGGAAFFQFKDGRRAVIDIGDDTGISARMEFLFTYGRVIIENEPDKWRLLMRSEQDRSLPLTRYGSPLVEHAMSIAPCTIIDMTKGALLDAASDEPPVSSAYTVGLKSVELFSAVRVAGESGEGVGFPLSDDAEARIFKIP